MATRAAMVDMEDAASKRIDAAAAELSERLGVTPKPVQFERVPAMQHIRLIEAQADLLEQIVEVTAPKKPVKDEPAKTEAKPAAKAKDA